MKSKKLDMCLKCYGRGYVMGFSLSECSYVECPECKRAGIKCEISKD